MCKDCKPYGYKQYPVSFKITGRRNKKHHRPTSVHQPPPDLLQQPSLNLLQQPPTNIVTSLIKTNNHVLSNVSATTPVPRQPTLGPRS